MSPFMLYSMARRYDEFPDSARPRAEGKERDEEDTGSSLRGAMKGWYKHGVCRLDLWRGRDMPPPATRPEHDWWLDAARRPLGAYYRVDTRSVTDMHVGLHDVGILYASVVCHSGWLEGRRAGRGKQIWTIPRADVQPDDGGHAFAIVGYTREGFIIQNSWGTTWGTRGLAVLTYEDWAENAMDCWVAQLGVATDLHLEIARSPSLRMDRGKVKIASDSTLRDREISPFVIDMENNGRLSDSGIFRTKPGDVAPSSRGPRSDPSRATAVRAPALGRCSRACQPRVDRGLGPGGLRLRMPRPDDVRVALLASPGRR
jgi:hypothetical protein